ncbi:MAG: AAA family ATPase [Gammaproteobacteria bacterium]|nr:AAA family ATPase [Gammaproteobacteria bacterium]
MPHRDHSPARGTNPFLAPGDDDFFYATAQITQRLNLLHHLGRYSDQVMVLTGPEGSGKTTLTDRLLREGQNAWRATVVEAHVETSAEQLLARALAGLDVHGSIITEKDGLDALQTHLAAAARGGLPTLLVVDDAQFLAAPVLKLLLRLARHPDYPGLRLLLVGDPAFADRVAGALGETIFHLVELPPFGQEQCMHYITMRLDRSGTPAHDLFTAERVDRLWKDSGGYPGPLNRLAARIIEKPARPATPAATRAPRTAPPTRTRTMARSARGNRRLLAVIGGAALLLTLAITALLPRAATNGIRASPVPCRPPPRPRGPSLPLIRRRRPRQPRRQLPGPPPPWMRPHPTHRPPDRPPARTGRQGQPPAQPLKSRRQRPPHRPRIQPPGTPRRSR